MPELFTHSMELPDTVLFQPSELIWAAFKTRLRKDLATAANPFLFIADMSQCYC